MFIALDLHPRVIANSVLTHSILPSEKKIKYILVYGGKVGNISLFFISIYEDVVLIDSVAKGQSI